MADKTTSFKFDDKTSDLLTKLKDETSATSRAEVIRKALVLLDVVYDAKNKNKQLIIKDEETGAEQIILLW